MWLRQPPSVSPWAKQTAESLPAGTLRSHAHFTQTHTHTHQQNKHPSLWAQCLSVSVSCPLVSLPVISPHCSHSGLVQAYGDLAESLPVSTHSRRVSPQNHRLLHLSPITAEISVRDRPRFGFSDLLLFVPVQILLTHSSRFLFCTFQIFLIFILGIYIGEQAATSQCEAFQKQQLLLAS